MKLFLATIARILADRLHQWALRLEHDAYGRDHKRDHSSVAGK